MEHGDGPGDATAASSPDKAKPIALLFCTDLMFSVEVQNMARKAGYRTLTVRPGSELPQGYVLIVDLSSRGDWSSAIAAARSRQVPVIAFGPHMAADARARARQAGATRVLANSNLARSLPIILRDLQAGVDAGNHGYDEADSDNDE